MVHIVFNCFSCMFKSTGFEQFDKVTPQKLTMSSKTKASRPVGSS